MFKRFFSFFILSIFSFIITSLFIKYIKLLDPIMFYLKDNQSYYNVDAVNATIDDFSMIPGKKGLVIDIDSSYSLMKKYGTFNEDLLVFKDVNPDISISNIYNKYISFGNIDKNEVSFIFKIDDDKYIKEIVSLLKEKEIIGTFFLNKELIYDKDLVIYLYLNNQEIEYYDLDYDFNLLRYASIFVSSYTSKSLSYCYNDSYNKSNITNCSLRRMHMIIPSISCDDYPFYEVKNKLSNGSIIKFESNKTVLYELRHIINYIRQKNYEIVSLKKMLEE